MQEFVFVYGTLKEGYGLHGVISALDLEDAGFTTEPGYRLLPLGAYPGLVREFLGGQENESSCYRVRGELYKLPMDNGERRDILRVLDRIEGEGSLYSRKQWAMGSRLIHYYEFIAWGDDWKSWFSGPAPEYEHGVMTTGEIQEWV